MTEAEWVESLVKHLQPMLPSGCEALVGKRLAYGLEATSYRGEEAETKEHGYQTDILVIERLKDKKWQPRIAIEAKVGSVTTHDAITYSQKAASHKAVHPYLRYGIILGDRGTYPLPGRLFRHGAHFDFMFSFAGTIATKSESAGIIGLLREELNASRTLEKILYESRKRGRDRYTLLQRKLILG